MLTKSKCSLVSSVRVDVCVGGWGGGYKCTALLGSGCKFQVHRGETLIFGQASCHDG